MILKQIHFELMIFPQLIVEVVFWVEIMELTRVIIIVLLGRVLIVGEFVGCRDMVFEQEPLAMELILLFLLR